MSIDELQSDLSDDLQLLTNLEAHLLYAISPVPRERDAEREIKLLDAIALCLVSGKSRRDAVAVTLERRMPLTLVLSKNGNPSEEDREAAVEFFRIIRLVEDSNEILRFVMSTSSRIYKRRTKLSIMLKDVYRKLECYDVSTMENEFSKSKHIDLLRDRYGDMEAREVLRKLLDHICTSSRSEPAISISDQDVESMAELLHLTHILRKSRFVATVLEDGWHWKRTFVRRLDKLCQYRHAIHRIFDARPIIQRFIPGKTIPHRWAEGAHDRTGARPVTMSASILEAARKRYPEIAEMQFCLDSLRKPWKETITPVVHAPLWLITHFSKIPLELVEEPDIVPFAMNRLPKQLIGYSKTCCKCCDRWIDQYNEAYGQHWMTSSSHGEDYRDWALTGLEYMDRKVIKYISDHVDDELYEMTRPSPNW